jgi:hypothetical protein
MASSTEQAVSEYFAAIRAMDAERWLSVFALVGLEKQVNAASVTPL